MTPSLHQAILNELNVAKDKPRPAVRWRSFSKREWEHALTWLDLSGLAIYFVDRIRSLNGPNTLPNDVQADLEKRRADNELRTRAILREFHVLTDSFTQARVNYAVLKGIALLPDYCPDPALRTQYDHDVLVDTASLAAAEAALLNAGYQRKIGIEDESCVVYRRPEPQIRFSRNSEGLYAPQLGRSIEVHLTLWEQHEDRIHVNLPDDFLKRRVLREWSGLQFMALCDEDSLLFQVLHAFKHILRNWCRLSIFHEIAFFLRRRACDMGFWTNFADRMGTIRWAPEASLVVFTLAEQLFGAPAPRQLLKSFNIPRAPSLILWIERYGRRAALSNFHGDKCSLFLHQEFVEDPKDWADIRRRRLFPIQRPHRPPAVVFQRGFSTAGRLWMENIHALRRLIFHGFAGLRYAMEYPLWSLLRRLRLAGFGDA